MSTLSDEFRLMRAAERVQSFRYPAMQPGFSSEGLAMGWNDQRAVRDATLQQEISAAVAAAREKGFHEGQDQGNAAATEAIEQERTAILSAVRDFVEQRTEYFRRVEVEAVKLALAIAQKILHREAHMDPLLLAGIVRVGLDQMQEGTRVKLRTSPESAAAWAEFCSQHLQGRQIIDVVADDHLKSHACILEAEVGTTEISLDGQLREIESGFFDHLRDTPAELL